MQRPNVLLLYTDQQRWDTICAAGNDLIHTPNLDSLAQQGALFHNAFCNSPVCMPSRMSMLSGQYPSAVGAASNGVEMPEDIPCVHNILKSYGYRTGNIGKLHFLNHASFERDHRDPHPDYGFDVLINSDEPGCYDDAYIKWVEERAPDQVENCRCNTPPAWTGEPVNVHPRAVHEPYVFHGPDHLTHSAFVADETMEFIRQSANQPFFCIAGFYAPHAPINPPQSCVDLYDVDNMPLPVRNEGENLGDVSDAHWRKVKAYYYALITHIDEQVGRILSELDRCGQRENTIVVFTSDHGENLGDHGLVAKGYAYDSSSRVPLIVSKPDAFTGGKHLEEIVEGVDIVPTLLDWCGVQVPPFMQGRSFRPLLEGREYTQRESAFMQLKRPMESSWKAVRTHEFLYVTNANDEEKLYTLGDDPDQLQNRADDPGYEETLHKARHTLLRRWFDTEKQYPKRTGNY